MALTTSRFAVAFVFFAACASALILAASCLAAVLALAYSSNWVSLASAASLAAFV